MIQKKAPGKRKPFSVSAMRGESEKEVETEIKLGVGVEGYALLCQFGGGTVHSQEEVEACKMEIGHPAEGCPEGACGYRDRGIEAFDGSYVG